MNSAMTFTFNRLVLALVAAVVALATLGSVAGTAAAWDSDQFEPCTLDLTPETADNPLGTVHTVTATVTHKGWFNPQSGRYENCTESVRGAGPLAGVTVNFAIVSGPNTGQSGSAVTDANGVATWQWVGNTAGTDVVRASLNHTYCEEFYDYPGWNWNLSDCPSPLASEVLQDEATKNWIPDPPPPPDPPVTPDVAPNVVIAVSKKCVSRTFVVRSKNSGSYKVTKSVLYIDGKRVRTNKTGTFKINTGRYSTKNHKFKVVTTFSNGTVITKTGTFKLCKSRVTSRKLDPRFTG
jgi:hypothetical protein